MVLASTALSHADDFTRVDATVQRLLEAGHVTGAGIALFKDGKIAYVKAYGFRDTEKRLPLTTNSVMPAASLSKSAFATMTMRLVEDRVIDIDKPIEQYLPKALPEYPKYADLAGDDRYKKITLRILLSHTSGFANWRAFENDRKLKIHFEPGTRFAYSGEGISLAQFVVETVTGQSVDALIDKILCQPLHMTRTSMIWQSRFEDDFANGYDEYGRSLGPQKRSRGDAAGSMQTTVQDYATLLSAIMRRPSPNVMFTAQVAGGIHSAHQFPSLAVATTTANDAIHLGYGLGWGLYMSPHGKAFFKEGHDEGWRHLALCFSDGTGILIMTNSSNGEGIFKPIIDSLLGETQFPFDWEGYTPYDKLPPLPKLKEHKKVTLTADQLRSVIGRYALGKDAVMTITVEAGHVFAQENDEPKQEVFAESPLNFYSAASTDEYSFKVDGAGVAQALVLHVDGKEIELKRVR